MHFIETKARHSIGFREPGRISSNPRFLVKKSEETPEDTQDWSPEDPHRPWKGELRGAVLESCAQRLRGPMNLVSGRDHLVLWEGRLYIKVY